MLSHGYCPSESLKSSNVSIHKYTVTSLAKMKIILIFLCLTVNVTLEYNSLLLYRKKPILLYTADITQCHVIDNDIILLCRGISEMQWQFRNFGAQLIVLL